MNILNKDFLKIDFDFKFDIIVGNPPYNKHQEAKGKRGGGDSLWDDFVRKSLKSTLKDGGYLVYVHPASWRKPPSDKSKTKDLLPLMCRQNQMLYLEIHSTKDGQKTFNAGTRYDFYCIKRINKFENSIVIDENGKKLDINFSEWDFLPNSNIDSVKELLGNEGDEKCEIIFNRTNYGSDKKWVKSEKCEIIFSNSKYETRKKWVKSEKCDEFKYPLIHSTPKSGIRYMYSSRNDNGHFGIPKVIFGESGINDVIVDFEGRYGMTQHSMGIKIGSIEEGTLIKDYLLSDDFKEILKNCMWGNFRIDWRLFSYFKKDFWKEL